MLRLHVTRTATIFLALIQLAVACAAGIQNNVYIDPSMISLFAHRGFLNVSSLAHGPFVYEMRRNAPLTIEVFMPAMYTPHYDYMIEGCFANGYPFVDNHGCVQCDAIFVGQVESPQYWDGGRAKRTLIYLHAYQPLDSDIINIECSFLLVPCRGCTQRSCERGITPGKDTPTNYQRFTKNVEVQLIDGAFGVQVSAIWCAENYGLTWWIVLIIVLLILLLILALILLICCCLSRRQQRNVQPVVNKFNFETDNYRTPSESLSQYTSGDQRVSRSNSARIAAIA